MTKNQRRHLLWAMEVDGMSPFWLQLVADAGPRGEAVGRRLYDTMPSRYRRQG